MPYEVTPTLSVEGLHVRVTVLLFATTADRLVGVLGGMSSLPGGGGSTSSGAVQGATGPATTAAPISKTVPSWGVRPSHSIRDSLPRARVTSAALNPV